MPFFGWPKPRCPVGCREKGWVEVRMRWLGDQLGTERLTRCEVILPSEQYFPDAYDGTPEAARRLLDRLCQYVGVYPPQIDLQIRPKGTDYEPAGPNVIQVMEFMLPDPMVLASTLVHELTYQVLHERKVLGDEPDRHWTTDLATVLFGLGIFTANATAGIHGHASRSSWLAMGRRVYLPARVTGYALALHAWLCGESKPAWVGYLSRDVADVLSQGLDYLGRTEDSLLRPDNLHGGDQNPSVDKLLNQLDQGSDSERVVALWELARRGPAAAAAVQPLAQLLTDRQPAIRAEAARTLAELGPAAEPAVLPLIEALGDSEEEVRVAAAYASGRLHMQPEMAVAELTDRLDDPVMLNTAAWALAQYAAVARPALPRLLATLRHELGCDGEIDHLLYAVRAISPDPDAELQQLVASCDPDLQRQAGELLPESGPIASPPGSSGWWYWGDGPA